MVRWWRIALLVLAGAVTAVATAVLTVTGNVLTGGKAPKGFPESPGEELPAAAVSTASSALRASPVTPRRAPWPPASPAAR